MADLPLDEQDDPRAVPGPALPPPPATPEQALAALLPTPAAYLARVLTATR